MALRNKAWVAVGAVALILSACGHEAAQARLDVRAAPGSEPLTLTDDGANAKLASADSGLMLECEHGARTIHLTQVGAAAGPLTLASAGVRSVVAAESQSFEGKALLLAEAPSDTPALKAFRRSAALQVDAGGVTRLATAAEGGAERFFAACEARA